MGRFMRIFLLAFFVLTVSATPLLAMGGWFDGSGGNSGNGGSGKSSSGGTPEIDPSLAPIAIALLSGGLLILKGKSGKRLNKD